MANRHTDALYCPAHHPLPPLPVVDWSLIGREAPKRVDVPYGGPKAPLPKVDIVVITWTTAEWSALDHVFLNSGDVRYSSSRAFEQAWHLYAKDAPPNAFSPLWGKWLMVQIDDASGKTRDVLLFKADAHLAHPPWIKGLLEMIGHIIEDARPQRVYSIGTAGGSTDDERLGDTVITNAGHIELELDENDGVSWNDTTVTCKSWYPSLDLVPDVEKRLLFSMQSVVTKPTLEYLICELHREHETSRDYGYDDLISAPIAPGNLEKAGALDRKGTPLLTTDYYYIATGTHAAKYSALEMDDTVIGYVCDQKGVDFAFVRNISDPLVPAKTPGGAKIPADVRGDWSSAVYNAYGLYTSMNGALLTWATIAGDPGAAAERSPRRKSSARKR